VEERFHFRTSSLLNVEVTAPYGHTGAYQTLEEVVRHYNNPRESIDLLFGMHDTNESINESAPFCQLPQISDLMVKNSKTCAQLYPNAYANSVEVTDYLELARDDVVETRFALRGRRNLNDDQITRVVSFLKSLTDPCVKDRTCLSSWILETDAQLAFPDALPLEAHDKNSSSL
jgi:cytochrome c peroxidase